MEKINSFLEHYKFALVLSFVGLVLIIGGIITSGATYEPRSFPKASLVNKSELLEIKIDISGAIKFAGVYSLPHDSRIIDAIKRAGGFASSADKEYIQKKLNLSQKLTDGQKIYIPFEGEKFSGTQVSGVQASLVNINLSSTSELESLPGVGPITAQNIIASRPYSEINELLSKKVVSKSVFEKIKNLIVI